MANKICVVFDGETDTTFDDFRGIDRDQVLLQFMQLTCVCALEIPSESVLARCSPDETIAASTAHTFWRDEEAGRPFEGLLELFDRAEVVVGYNAFGFDFPLLWRHYALGNRRARYVYHRAKTVDVFGRARDSCVEWPKLDVLLRENALQAKSGDGRQAVSLWREGKRAQLEAYCAMDVELTGRLALLDDVSIMGIPLSGAVFGLRSAIRAARA